MNENLSKEQQVEAMFNGIAPRYDFLNRVLSFGIDKLWRRRLIKSLLKSNPTRVLDVATGTADLAILLAKKNPKVTVIGVDIAEQMLSFGRVKVERKNLDERVVLTRASSERLPFDDASFDATMVAFGVRNFENPINGLKEMNRVIKPGGGIYVLEFTNPRSSLIRFIYRFYFNRILPWIGRKVSGHSSAYTYLPTSVEAFEEREAFVNLLYKAGFVDASFKLQSLGIAAIYSAIKPK